MTTIQRVTGSVVPGGGLVVASAYSQLLVRRLENRRRGGASVTSRACHGWTVRRKTGHRDGVVEYGVALRRDLAAAIRRHRPELVVVTFNHHDYWGHGTWNSADHRAVGRAVFDATADAGNRWIFPDAGEPWTVRWIAVAGSPNPTHAVDIAATFDRAVASLAAHRTYLEALGQDARTVLETIFGAPPVVRFELLGE
ncbi:MAG: PIG-L deacetylase family protein [Pseudonocardiaceae bacterium]